MKHTIDCCGPDYPENLQVKDVNVYIHPCGMISTHDYSCPVCGVNHAVHQMSTGGIMQPCRECEKKGYKILKRTVINNSLLRRMCKLFDIYQWEEV